MGGGARWRPPPSPSPGSGTRSASTAFSAAAARAALPGCASRWRSSGFCPRSSGIASSSARGIAGYPPESREPRVRIDRTERAIGRRRRHDRGCPERPQPSCAHYIEENFLYLHPGLELKDDDEFLTLGIVDSLGFVELVEEVQARYAITVEDVEITEENFGSIDAIVGVRRAEATLGLSARTLGEDLRAAAARDPERQAVVDRASGR